MTSSPCARHLAGRATPSRRGCSPRSILRSRGPPRNALTPNQTSTFGPTLTVVYGANAAGESGYTRTWKRVPLEGRRGDPWRYPYALNTTQTSSGQLVNMGTAAVGGLRMYLQF